MADTGGVRKGMTVRDGAGRALGKVDRVYAWGFEVVKGFWQPRTHVFKHEEVVRLDGETLHVSRSPDDLLRLARGELPAGWAPRPSPFGGAIPAAPAEARSTFGPPSSPVPGAAAATDEGREAELARGAHPTPAGSR
jgi:hypothetical protein